VLDDLASGAVTLTAVTLLAPHLTEDNHRDVLESARHKPKRHVEQIVARLHPRPDVPAAIRRLPERRAPSASAVLVAVDVESRAAMQPAPAAMPASVAVPSRPAPSVVTPLAPERFKVQFTVSRETHDRLRRAQDLLRHAIPNGDPAEVFDRALTLLIGHLEKQKFAAVERPRAARSAWSNGRRIPAAVRRTVWHRDGGRCAFVGHEGRCAATGHLEFHHVVPFARGGVATEENIQLRCRAHNQHEAELEFSLRRPLFVRESAVEYRAVGTVTRSGPSCLSSGMVAWPERTTRV
jgi:5-methylcytosine-specific restriction endonuclease McrA